MATRQLQVYLDLMSQPCRAVQILLDSTEIPHTVRTVALRRDAVRESAVSRAATDADISKHAIRWFNLAADRGSSRKRATVGVPAEPTGENRTPDFTELNPMQKVPVLVEEDFILTESDAIMKYLATRYDVPEHWYPRQPERRARVDEYTAWHQTNTRPHAAKVFILEVLLPGQTGSQVDEGRLNRALSQLEDTLDKLESMFLRRQPFLCGDDITVADLLAVCELMQPLGGGRDVLQRRPELQRWRSRVQAAVGESFDRAHAVLYALRDRRKAKL